MVLLDRYTGEKTEASELPSQIDFGRYFLLNNGQIPLEITYSNFQTNKIIRQDLLLDKNKSLQEIFIDIGLDAKKARNDEFNVTPLIRRIRNKLDLNSFEELLRQKIFHLEEVFRNPHYLLDRIIEKVNVSRAKRIPSKSYQYLASHTEDWIHKSIVNFKPARILNEELDLNYNIYENQLTVAFIERCLVYLNSRIKEVQDIRLFLKEYGKLLKDRDDQKGWYKKIARNLSLIGAEYDDENYHGRESDGATLSATEELLDQMNRRLLLLRKSDLFGLINKRTIQSITLRNTNVLVNHKHYRYVKSLWIELDKIKPVKSELEKLRYEQDVLNGLVSYANCLFAYSLKINLDFDLSGSYNSIKSEHLYYPKVKLFRDSDGTLKLTIGKQTLKLIIIGNAPSDVGNLSNILKNQNAYLLYYSENVECTDERIININPLDPDSVERIGGLLKKYFLKDYVSNISRKYEFKHLLRDYTRHISCNYLVFYSDSFSYKFISFPHSELRYEVIHQGIECDDNYRSKKSRIEKDNILHELRSLIEEINSNAYRLKKDYLICFNCGETLEVYAVSELNYLKCPCCHGVVNSSVQDSVNFLIEDERYKSISTQEFGMDYLKVKLSEL